MSTDSAAVPVLVTVIWYVTVSPTSAASGLSGPASVNVPSTPLSETFLSSVRWHDGFEIGAPASRSFGSEVTESDERLCIQNQPFGLHGFVSKRPAPSGSSFRLTAASPNWPAPMPAECSWR